MQRVRLARDAMATRFEFVLAGEDERRLRAAGEEALDEIERVEAQLSLYRSSSEIAQVNRRAATEPVRVSPEVFHLLQSAFKLHEITGGTFDISIAPLVRCWGFMKGSGSRPTDEEIAQARAQVGMAAIELDESAQTVRFNKPGMMLDLGSLGKGYGLDSAADILRENGVESALLHGGTSTICGIGVDPAGAPWKVAIEMPVDKPGEQAEVLSVVELRDAALSVSAVWGKHFTLNGELYGHVIDPRTGWPARGAVLGAVRVASAAVSDALSTAVLLAGDGVLEKLEASVPGLAWLRLARGDSGLARQSRVLE